jgi:RTA1 like protein
LFLQLIGAVIVSGTQPTDQDAANKLQRGKDIALVGVTAQIVAFGLFSVVAARFHFTSRSFVGDMEKRYNITPGTKYTSVDGTNRKFNPNWRTILFVINLACALILVRSAYREVDFAMGKGSYVEQYEYL